MRPAATLVPTRPVPCGLRAGRSKRDLPLGSSSLPFSDIEGGLVVTSLFHDVVHGTLVL